MKLNNTHSLEQVEALMWKESDILKDPNVGKEAKKEARKRLKLLEKHFRDCKDKEINGRTYPVKKKPVDISKKELLTLIDSVPDGSEINRYMIEGLDTSGVSPGSNRFSYKE